MASAGQVDVKVAVKPKIAIGTSTVAGGTVSLVAFALALVAFWQGARDEATVSALVVGLVSLVTVLGGRYAQAVAALVVTTKRPVPAQGQNLSFSTVGGHGFRDATMGVARRIDGDPAAIKENTAALQEQTEALKRQTDFATSVTSTSNFQLTQSLADLISGHIVGRGVAGRAFTPGSGVEYAYPDDEPGDPDALPEYETSEDVPPDEGDEHARPEAE